MNTLVKPRSQTHWYHKDGSPCWSVPLKTDPTRTRKPTIRDARKMGLLPGVTGVLKVLAKPGLQRWIREQTLMAALTLPREHGESLEDFARRAIEDADREAADAADLGVQIHDRIARWLTGEPVILDDGAAGRAVRAFIDFWATSGYADLNISVEESFASKRGYAGRRDIVVRDCDKLVAIIDIKTQKTKPGKKAATYPEWALQLAGYSDDMVCDLTNVVLSTTEPGRLDVRDWAVHLVTLRWHWRNILSLWAWLNNYHPEGGE